MAEVTTVLQDLSNDLAANNTNTSAGTANTADQSNVNFARGSGDAHGIQYFTIAGLDIDGGAFTGIIAQYGVTTVINVAGANVMIGVTANQQLTDVLFNFCEATPLTINSGFGYSVLAPSADVILQGGGIFGNLVSDNLRQNAEVRPYNDTNIFDGSLPQPNPISVSAPATLGLMLTGAGIVMLLMQRRRAGHDKDASQPL